MIKLTYYIFSLIVPLAVSNQMTFSKNENRFEYYRQLNNKETRLSEFKDDDEALKLKLLQMDIINSSRAKHRAKPVDLDILACRVANKACKEAAENKYISHWNLAGEKPYHRYAFAGGCDHVSENVFGESTSGTYNNTPTEVSGLMEDGHESFMSERAPANGHKKNIIDKNHNFVGIGFYLADNQFRYNEEFVDRYLEFENVPFQLNAGQSGEIIFKTDGKYYPYFLIIYREDFPVSMKPEQLNRKGSYSDFSNEQFLDMPAWEIARFNRGNLYRLPVKFTKEGLYYIQICVDKHNIKTPSRLNTKGKIIASGIVIKVIR